LVSGKLPQRGHETDKVGVLGHLLLDGLLIVALADEKVLHIDLNGKIKWENEGNEDEVKEKRSTSEPVKSSSKFCEEASTI